MTSTATPDPAQILRQHGLSVTAQRLAVMAAVGRHPHATADVVFEVVSTDIGSVSRQAVYDALGVLAENGIIRRIQPAGSAARCPAACNRRTATVAEMSAKAAGKAKKGPIPGAADPSIYKGTFPRG